ncbi:MAG: penicillin-binding protein activator LpoB [Deltaproteobacteria bacterium]|nr:penicillin-binding protein activator LpoB [Deltaproteobacteria bacterium]
MKTWIWIAVCFFLLAACGPRQYSGGKYVDPSKTDLLSDQFVETDMQKIAKDLSKSLLKSPITNEPATKPTVMMSLFSNATDEHIDMIALSQKIRTEIFKGQKFTFLNERLRGKMEKEYEYEDEDSGFVSPETAKRKGSQTGADYLISGYLSSIRQPVGRREIVYYKTTLELTNLSTGEIAWTDEVELKKTFRKKHVGN